MMKPYEPRQKQPGHPGDPAYPQRSFGNPGDPAYPQRSFNQSYPGDSHKEPFVSGKKPKQLYKPLYFLANGASFIMALVGTVFFLLAFGGPSWYILPPETTIVPKTFGLWKLCVRSECVVDMTNDYMVKKYLLQDIEEGIGNPGFGKIGNFRPIEEVKEASKTVIYAYENFLTPVKVLMCITVISVFVMVATNMAFIAGFTTFFLEAIAQMFAGLLVALAVGIFGGKFRDDIHNAPFGWSYWCGVVAAIVFLANGACMMVISVFVFRKRGGFSRRKR